MMLSRWAVILVLFTAAAVIVCMENRGRWTMVLDFPRHYENAEDLNGNPIFECQGVKLDPFDPLLHWWNERCYDNVKNKTKRPKICNSTAICCYKYCVLQRIEWVDKDYKLNREKAHKFLQHEYSKKKYPSDVVADIIDEYDRCAEWYDQRDREGCSNNGPYAKCNSHVLLKACHRRSRARSHEEWAPQEAPTKVGRGVHPGQSIRYEVDENRKHTCVSKCKSLCLGQTKFS